MNFVTPMLAVGSRDDALNSLTLRRHKIGAILSLAEIAPPATIDCHHYLEMSDRVPVPPRLIQQAVDYLESCTARGLRVLIHCQMGISRSPTLAACFLHQTAGMPLCDALKHLKEVRPQVAPHPTLLASVYRHYEQPWSRTDTQGVAQ